MDISTIDTFNFSLIDQYVEGDPNEEFEKSMMESLFQQQKYEIIVYALNKGFTLTDKIEEQILKSGNLSLYQYLDQQGRLKFTPKLIVDLLQVGTPVYMDTLKWLHSKGCGWEDDECSYVVENLELLKWLYENECPLHKLACVCYAANVCNVESLKWLHANNFPFDKYTYTWVIDKKQLQIYNIQFPSIDSQIETLNCLKDLGCPCMGEVFIFVEEKLSEKIKQWIDKYAK